MVCRVLIGIRALYCARVGHRSVAPSGAFYFFPLVPTAGAMGYHLTPLRGWRGAPIQKAGRISPARRAALALPAWRKHKGASSPRPSPPLCGGEGEASARVHTTVASSCITRCDWSCGHSRAPPRREKFKFLVGWFRDSIRAANETFG